MIIHSNFSKMKNKILPTCLQGNYGDSLGELGSTSLGMGELKIRRLVLKKTVFLRGRVR